MSERERERLNYKQQILNPPHCHSVHGGYGRCMCGAASQEAGLCLCLCLCLSHMCLCLSHTHTHTHTHTQGLGKSPEKGGKRDVGGGWGEGEVLHTSAWKPSANASSSQVCRSFFFSQSRREKEKERRDKKKLSLYEPGVLLCFF